MPSPSFHHVQPGQSADASPARSASWLNAVSDTAADHRRRKSLGEPPTPPAGLLDSGVYVRVANTTDQDLLRGDLLQLGQYRLDELDPRRMWFEGDLPSGDSDKTYAVLRQAASSAQTTQPNEPAATGGQAVWAQLMGVSTLRVEFQPGQDTAKFAEPVADEAFARVATSGSIRVLWTPPDAGTDPTPTVYEAPVLIGLGADSTSVKVVMFTGTITGATWDEAGNGRLTPSFEVAAELVLDEQGAGNNYEPGGAVDVRVPFVAPGNFADDVLVDVSPGKAVIGVVVGGWLAGLDCREIDEPSAN